MIDYRGVEKFVDNYVKEFKDNPIALWDMHRKFEVLGFVLLHNYIDSVIVNMSRQEKGEK